MSLVWVWAKLKGTPEIRFFLWPPLAAKRVRVPEWYTCEIISPWSSLGVSLKKIERYANPYMNPYTNAYVYIIMDVRVTHSMKVSSSIPHLIGWTKPVRRMAEAVTGAGRGVGGAICAVWQYRSAAGRSECGLVRWSVVPSASEMDAARLVLVWPLVLLMARWPLQPPLVSTATEQHSYVLILNGPGMIGYPHLVETFSLDANLMWNYYAQWRKKLIWFSKYLKYFLDVRSPFLQWNCQHF